MKLEPNTLISQRYEILEQIGVGGMSNVYCANDIKLDRKVTFKVLKEEFIDEEFINKFNKEAMAAAKISHLNIANVYDVGNEDNIHYIVMEYVDGYTLKDIIKIKAPFSNEEILGIGIQISTALQVAHNAGIVHRDIKPQNILVTKQGTIKVADFGLARISNSNTITTDAMGSVHYFSPEQARGSYVDFKTDIYSFGIVMYEMATGNIPFDGEGVVQLAMKHINEPLPSIKEINPKISDSIEKIILKATSKSPDKRYDSTDNLTEDLKKALYDQSGSFVSESSFDENSLTVVISPEEIEMINKLTNQKNEKLKNKPNLKKTSTVKPIKNLGKTTSGFNVNEKETNKKVVIGAVLTSLFSIVLITSFILFWIISGQNSNVPNFVGKSFEQAVNIAKKAQIYIINTAEEYSDTIPEGAIISQSAEPGTKVEKGVNIEVTLSLGTGKFELDNYVGLDISEVYRKIEDVPITIKEEYINDLDVDRGKVIRQMPLKGTVIKPNEEVTLYVSKGTENSLVVVPNLINNSEEDAKATLSSMGLKLGRITKSESNNIEKGFVISQSINYGNEVDEGTAISLVISSGHKETTQTTTSVTTTEAILEDTTQTTTKVQEQQVDTTVKSTLKQDTLTISPNLSDSDSSVEVRIVKVSGGSSSEVYVGAHKAADFPLKINVVGSEPTEYQLYVDGKLIGTETKFN